MENLRHGKWMGRAGLPEGIKEKLDRNRANNHCRRSLMAPESLSAGLSQFNSSGGRVAGAEPSPIGTCPFLRLRRIYSCRAFGTRLGVPWNRYSDIKTSGYLVETFFVSSKPGEVVAPYVVKPTRRRKLMRSKKLLGLLFAMALTVGSAVTAEVVIRVAPPAVRIEERGRPPGPGYLWISGYQRWDGIHYVWVLEDGICLHAEVFTGSRIIGLNAMGAGSSLRAAGGRSGLARRAHRAHAYELA